MIEVIPNRLITSAADNGILTDVVLQYRRKVNGVMDMKKYYTISVKNGVDLVALQSIVNAAIQQATSSENPT